MKKPILTIAIATVLLTSCSTPESSMISQADSFIKETLVPKLKDPSSYESISTEIMDTIKEVHENTKEEDNRITELLIAGTPVNLVIDTINKISESKVSYDVIRIKHKYKAMNGFGLVAPYEAILKYNKEKYGYGTRHQSDMFYIYSNH